MHLRSASLTLLALAGLANLTPLVYAQSAVGTGYIEGVVVPDKGVPAWGALNGPIPGVGVSIRPKEGLGDSTNSWPSGGGTYALRNLKPGAYEVFVDQSLLSDGGNVVKYRPQHIFGVVVEPDTRTALDITVHEGVALEEVGTPEEGRNGKGLIEGVVVTDKGVPAWGALSGPIPGVRVSIRSKEGLGDSTNSWPYGGGIYALRDLKPGVYEVFVDQSLLSDGGNVVKYRPSTSLVPSLNRIVQSSRSRFTRASRWKKSRRPARTIRILSSGAVRGERGRGLPRMMQNLAFVTHCRKDPLRRRVGAEHSRSRPLESNQLAAERQALDEAIKNERERITSPARLGGCARASAGTRIRRIRA